MNIPNDPFIGTHYIGKEELRAAKQVLKAKSFSGGTTGTPSTQRAISPSLKTQPAQRSNTALPSRSGIADAEEPASGR